MILMHKILNFTADSHKESGEDYLYPASYFAPIKVPAAVKESLQRAS